MTKQFGIWCGDDSGWLMDEHGRDVILDNRTKAERVVKEMVHPKEYEVREYTPEEPVA